MWARVAVLAAVALLGITADASATAWNVEGHGRLVHGETVDVAATGSAKVIVRSGKHVAFTSECTENSTEALSNTAKSGLDETRAASYSCAPAPCGEVRITAVVPWHSVLVGTTAPQHLLTSAMTLTAACGPTTYGTFSGAISATYGDGDHLGPDEIDNNYKLVGIKSGTLAEPGSGDTLVIKAVLKYGTKGLDAVRGEA